MKDAPRALVVHAGGIGDFLLAWPALRGLAARGPVEVAGRKERMDLAVAAGWAAAAHDLDAIGFDSVFSEPSERLRSSLQRFQRAVVWMKDTGEIGDALRACGVQEVHTFPGLPPADWARHASEYYVECLRARGLLDAVGPLQGPHEGESMSSVGSTHGYSCCSPSGNPGARPLRRQAGPMSTSKVASENSDATSLRLPQLRWTWETSTVGAALPRLDVVIHPGSGGKAKNWPLERFLQVSEALEAEGRAVTWCLGPAEESLELPMTAKALKIESLVALARELARAQLYIGNDSGITHLAAAVGCRTVAIFGPTNPRVWAPLGKAVRVVHRSPWPDVAEVLEAARDLQYPRAR